MCLFRPDCVGDFLRSNQIMKSCQCLYTVVNCCVFLYNPTIRPEPESKPSVGESDRLQLEKRIDNTATRVMGLALKEHAGKCLSNALVRNFLVL